MNVKENTLPAFDVQYLYAGLEGWDFVVDNKVSSGVGNIGISLESNIKEYMIYCESEVWAKKWKKYFLILIKEICNDIEKARLSSATYIKNEDGKLCRREN